MLLLLRSFNKAYQGRKKIFIGWGADLKATETNDGGHIAHPTEGAGAAGACFPGKIGDFSML